MLGGFLVLLRLVVVALLLIMLFLIICIPVSVYACAHVGTDVWGDQRHWLPLELDLWAI